MPSWEHLLPFAAATLVFALMPGPAILYAIAQTMARGRKGGVLAAVGLACGGLAHVAAAAAGLSAIFKYSPALFLIVKVGGALYLLWLGIQIIRSKGAAEVPKPGERKVLHVFLQSIVVELLNPKTALFFIAFLPQFVDGGASLPIWAQMAILGLIVNLSFSVVDISAIMLADRALYRLRHSPRMARAVKYCGGSVLVGLGAHMALSGN